MPLITDQYYQSLLTIDSRAYVPRFMRGIQTQIELTIDLLMNPAHKARNVDYSR
ncbi:Uncharacterised protein [Legionella quateirensis]|uniref:Uncharacterized protein n=1 Tax=Legionella quateirensis TaxID=45072 RepID=A0A378KTJ4_9GAMM|nr:hypothetical protein Lqua_1492 [Legionella quateirensis]STY17489.1 Uncharacterised protein [Legionella quateirensis]